VIAYLDTSAFVKLMLDEEDSAVADELWSSADVVVTSQLTYAEARAAVASAVRQGRLTRSRSAHVVDELDAAWQEVAAADVDAVVTQLAGSLAERYALRGADTVQLATALASRSDDTVFVTWDRRLAQGAQDAGFVVVPALPDQPAG